MPEAAEAADVEEVQARAAGLAMLGSPSAPLLLVGAVALLAGALARIAFRGWRTSQEQRRQRRLGELSEGFRVEPHTSPVEVTVEPEHDNTRTFTVRLEPHPDPGTQTVHMNP